ncbi:hypothetical protein NUSPORA_00010 [Nucleospora cyclopteri]
MNFFVFLLACVETAETTFQERLNASLGNTYRALGNIGEVANSYFNKAKEYMKEKMNKFKRIKETDLIVKDEKIDDKDSDNLQKALQDLIKKMENISGMKDVDKIKNNLQNENDLSEFDSMDDDFEEDDAESMEMNKML